jgi:hypothetical protein
MILTVQKRGYWILWVVTLNQCQYSPFLGKLPPHEGKFSWLG